MLASHCCWHPAAHHGREPRWHKLGLPPLAQKGQGEGRGLRPVREPTGSRSERGLCSRSCWGRTAPAAPSAAAAAAACPAFAAGAAGGHVSGGWTDFWELPSKQATFQHAYSPSSAEEMRAQNKDNSSVPRLLRLHGRGNAKMYQTMRGPGLLPALIHAAVAGSPQAARSISCDAEGPTSAMYNSTLDKQPRACAAHRRDARASRVSATAMWALQGPRAPAAPEQGCVSTARKGDSV